MRSTRVFTTERTVKVSSTSNRLTKVKYGEYTAPVIVDVKRDGDNVVVTRSDGHTYLLK